MAVVDYRTCRSIRDASLACEDCSSYSRISHQPPHVDCFDICSTCTDACVDGQSEVCCDDVGCPERIDLGSCDECCLEPGCELQPCDANCATDCATSLPICTQSDCDTPSIAFTSCRDCEHSCAWQPFEPSDSSSANDSMPITPEQSWHGGHSHVPFGNDEYGMLSQAGCRVHQSDDINCMMGVRSPLSHANADAQMQYVPSGHLVPNCDGDDLYQTIPEEDNIGMSSIDPHHCHWNNCDLSFLDSMQFDVHFLNDHLLPLNKLKDSVVVPHDSHFGQSITCAWDSCQNKPESVPALLNHIKHDHVDVEQHHRCKWLVTDECGNTAPCNLCLKTAKALTKHISEHHIGSRQPHYTCYWQDCDRCTRPFPQRQKIIRHIVVHTGDRPYKCHSCGYTCSEEAVLKQHQRIHTGEKPFECSICSRSFSASTALSVHMRTHTGFKPLVCKHPGCNKRFSESSNLAKHMRTHSETRTFVCDVPACGKSFQRPDQLKRHKRSVHKITPIEQKSIQGQPLA